MKNNTNNLRKFVGSHTLDTTRGDLIVFVPMKKRSQMKSANHYNRQSAVFVETWSKRVRLGTNWTDDTMTVTEAKELARLLKAATSHLDTLNS